MAIETRDERFFINWFNQFARNERILYVLIEDKERYLKTEAITRHPLFGRPKKDIDSVKRLYNQVWHKFKKIREQ